jgi:hypothetical protein
METREIIFGTLPLEEELKFLATATDADRIWFDMQGWQKCRYKLFARPTDIHSNGCIAHIFDHEGGLFAKTYSTWEKKGMEQTFEANEMDKAKAWCQEHAPRSTFF